MTLAFFIWRTFAQISSHVHLFPCHRNFELNVHARTGNHSNIRFPFINLCFEIEMQDGVTQLRLLHDSTRLSHSITLLMTKLKFSRCLPHFMFFVYSTNTSQSVPTQYAMCDVTVIGVYAKMSLDSTRTATLVMIATFCVLLLSASRFFVASSSACLSAALFSSRSFLSSFA